MSSQKLFEKKVINTQDTQFQPDLESWDFHYQKIISTLQGTQQQKEAIIRKRILRYFGEFKLEEQSYFSIRNDINYNIPGLQIIPTKLILYGVDYMSWERMKHYFQGFITNIVRMDDSHYVVEFRNESQCLTAINKYHKSRDIYFTSQDVFKSSKQGWIEMKPYHEFLFERKIMARYWTSADRIDNVCGSTKQSFSKAYSEAKRRFMKSLKQDSQNCMKERSYRGRSNSKQKQFRFNSRSRQKVYIYQRPQKMDQERAYQNYRPKRQCTCHLDRERRDRDNFRNRSRSRSPSFDNDFQRRRYSNLPRLSEYEKIQQTDMKFQMYIKKRDNTTHSKNDLSSQRKALSSIDSSMKKNRMSQKEKSSSTQQDCQPSIKGIPKISSKTNQALNSSNTNSEQMDFELFLERLKLEDTKNDFSAFDLDMEG